MKLAVTCAFVVALAGAGCPDPCVWLGNGCNVNSDCDGNEVCRVAREFEYVCPVVKGQCVAVDDDDRACGSVDDCGDDECCDPITNVCVTSVGYRSVKCDDATCGDCDETPFGDYCANDDDCDDDEGCTGLAFDNETRGICRPRCSSDDECSPIERCSTTCSVPIGTPCTDPEGSTECPGLECTDRDFGDDVVEPYCTGFCSGTEFSVCPANMACDEDTLRCRVF